jgi:hypothetical protein
MSFFKTSMRAVIRLFLFFFFYIPASFHDYAALFRWNFFFTLLSTHTSLAFIIHFSFFLSYAHFFSFFKMARNDLMYCFVFSFHSVHSFVVWHLAEYQPLF